MLLIPFANSQTWDEGEHTKEGKVRKERGKKEKGRKNRKVE